MHVLVVGAGLTGLQTAFALLNKGAEVTLIEAQRAPCQGASYCATACAGAKHPTQIASSATFMARLKAMASNTSNLKYGSKAAVRYASFISAMTSARAPEKFDLRTATLEALAEKSATLLRTDAQTYGFELQESAGTLVVHDTASTTDTMPTLQAIIAIEPSLYDARNVEGVTIERTTTWSSSFYAKQLREYLVSRNVRILCNHRVTGLISQNGQVKGIDCTTPLEADAVVVTAGLSSPDILPNECYGNVPLAPLTRAVYNVDLIADHRRVRHAVQSDDGRMIVPLDNFLRLIGHWYLGSPEQCDMDTEYQALWAMGVKLLPQAANWSQGRYLNGSVLSSPDGLPIVGASTRPGLYLNIAGGIHGGDFVCAYADATADAVLGHENPLLQPLSWSRFTA